MIAPSGGARERLEKSGCDPAKIDVLPYFCPLAPKSQPRPLPERKTITFMGRIAPNKGHQYFIKALGLLPDDYQGIMVGSFNNDSERSLMNLAKEAGCKNRLILKRWATREEVLAIMDQTTVFIFPSLWPETLGIVGIEAMARGVPVVASDIGGVREWLVDGVNGYLVQPKAHHAISSAVQSITESEQKTISFGKAGIQLINEKFLPSLHIDKLSHIYEQII